MLAVGLLVSLLAHSCYTKQVVIYHHRQGLKPGDISRKLQQEGTKATRRGIAKFLSKFIESASVARKPGSGRPSKRNGPCNGMDRGTERNVFRKTLSPCNTNGPNRFITFFGRVPYTMILIFPPIYVHASSDCYGSLPLP